MKNIPIESEPKRNNRFIVEFVGTTIESWTVTKTKRPTYNLDGGWEDLKFELLDPIGPSTSKAIFNDIIKKDKKNCVVKIFMLDPTGVVVETWTLYGDYISIDFGKIDYSINDISTIIIIFNIKRCKLD